ncbi:MAG: MBOAT family protein, partial [Spirochaetota bacterium]
MVSSFIFYGWWNPLYLILISWVICLDFTSVFLMHKTGRKKTFLAVSISGNLAVLGFFKYANFIINNINSFFTATGLAYTLPAADILLPVGI